MYAERYGGGRRFDPASLGVAVAVNAAVVGALLFAAPSVRKALIDPPIDIYNVPPEMPPPPPEVSPPKAERIEDRVFVPTPTVVTPTRAVDVVTLTDTPPLPTGTPTGTAGGTGVVVDPPVPPLPVLPPLIGAALDGRYADALQPGYPPEERRAEREGRVVARVLVGVDGRVKRIERLSATSDAFWRVTERQSARWRFKPATRGGVPEESWYRLALRFELEG